MKDCKGIPAAGRMKDCKGTPAANRVTDCGLTLRL